MSRNAIFDLEGADASMSKQTTAQHDSKTETQSIVEPIDRSALPAVPPFADKLSVAFLRENRAYPFKEADDGLHVAMADVGDTYAIQAIRFATGRTILAAPAQPEDIDAAIANWIRNQTSGSAGDANFRQIVNDDDLAGEDLEHLKDIALQTPVVQLVTDLLQDAIYARATDIHIEPFDRHLSIRMRVDGMLRDVSPPPASMARAIVSRLKIISGLDIAERRLPQDGRSRIRIGGRQTDLRVATMPTIHGEAMAIRLLDNVRRSLELENLGFSAESCAILREQLAAPYGMILVTGPTGSGKTTTLATAISILNDKHRKILTVEDPIEYELDGVNQTQVKPAIGLTFANALRAFLRHDPDVIMVGEMRDGETASIGIHAALTGHMVLTTLHTNSAAAAITRLLDMGVDGYLLASSLRCIVGQRLVRKLCTSCREPDDQSTAGPDDQHHQHWRAVGCERCFGTGYADRTVISEVLVIDDEIRALIEPGHAPGEIEAIARRKGMQTMWDDGMRQCRAGTTAVDEVRRVAAERS